MPIGDWVLACAHHSDRKSSTREPVAAGCLLNRIDANHSWVASQVVHTSKLGPAARYSGMHAVWTVARKRRDVLVMTGRDASFRDAKPTSGNCVKTRN